MSDDATPASGRRPSGRLRQLRDGAGFQRFLDKGLWPLLTVLSMLAIARIQHKVTTDDVQVQVAGAEKKVDEVGKVATETTKRAYRGLAEPANKTADALDAALARIAALEVAIKGQSAVIADFVVEGRPATKIDRGLLKVVKQNAAKSSKELAARAAKPLPKLKPVPLELPPAPPAAPAKIDHPTSPPALPSAPTAPPAPRDAGVPKS